MVDFALIQRLRDMGVQSAALAGEALVSVTFFPPTMRAALVQDDVVAAESARIAASLESAKARALRHQLVNEADRARQAQIQDELDRVLAEDYRYGHS